MPWWLPPFLLGCTAGALFFTMRNVFRHWRLTLRRELLLVRLAHAQQQLIQAGMDGDGEASAALLTETMKAHVAVADELVAQQALGFWQRVPPPGSDWPDTMPRAEILG